MSPFSAGPAFFADMPNSMRSYRSLPTIRAAAGLCAATVLAASPLAAQNAPAPVRRVTWYSAPYAAEAGAPHGAGTVLDGVDLAPSASRGATRRFQLLDRLVLTPPRGARPAIGTRLLLVRPGPELGAAQVLLPTGVAVVDGESADFVTARLDRVFDVVEAGHAVVPMPPTPAEADSVARTDAAAASSVKRDTRVAWIAGDAELPTIESVVVLATRAADDVREGDRFELIGDGRRVPGGPFLPGTRAAVVRVVRVTPFGASAVIESQQQPAITPGMLARPLGAM